MALPLIAAAARAGAAGARGAKRAGTFMGGGGGGGGEKPKAMSPEGVTMLMLAGVLEFMNIIIGILDFAIIGIILGPIVNVAGTILIGGWLWLRSGSPPIKKALGPLVLNSIPFAKFIPWWFIAVATSLEWQGAGGEQAAQEQMGSERPEEAQEEKPQEK